LNLSNVLSVVTFALITGCSNSVDASSTGVSETQSTSTTTVETPVQPEAVPVSTDTTVVPTTVESTSCADGSHPVDGVCPQVESSTSH
jgi:hypothetical protein